MKPDILADELYKFFMWFRDNGEKYMDLTVESMIEKYLEEVKHGKNV